MAMSIRVDAILGAVFVSALPHYSTLERRLSRMVVRDDADKLHLHCVLLQSRKEYAFSRLNPACLLRFRLFQCTPTRT
jgi:hypothetical protein